jgi:hypothetical protein
LYKTIRRDRALEFVSILAIVLAAIAYAATLYEAHANVPNDVRLLGYLQLPGADTSTRDHAVTDDGNVVLQGSKSGAYATWILQARRFADNAATPGLRNYVFVVGSLTFSESDGVATVELLAPDASGTTTIGTLHAVGPRLEPSQDSSYISIPPVVDSGTVFALPNALSCRATCTLRIVVAHGTWDIQRVGLESQIDPRIGPPLWTETFGTSALAVALSFVICGFSYGVLRYAFRSQADS